jgi:hypothetical protein
MLRHECPAICKVKFSLQPYLIYVVKLSSANYLMFTIMYVFFVQFIKVCFNQQRIQSTTTRTLNKPFKLLCIAAYVQFFSYTTRQRLMRVHYCKCTIAHTVLRINYCPDTLHMHYCTYTTILTLLHIHYCTRTTALILLHIHSFAYIFAHIPVKCTTAHALQRMYYCACTCAHPVLHIHHCA